MTIRKKYLNALNKLVIMLKTTPKLIKAIIRLHDFKSCGENDSPEDISELEKIRLQDVEWRSEFDRVGEI